MGIDLPEEVAMHPILRALLNLTADILGYVACIRLDEKTDRFLCARWENVRHHSLFRWSRCSLHLGHHVLQHGTSTGFHAQRTLAHIHPFPHPTESSGSVV